MSNDTTLDILIKTSVNDISISRYNFLIERYSKYFVATQEMFKFQDDVKKRLSSFPFISGDTYRAFSDIIFESNDSNDSNVSNVSNDSNDFTIQPYHKVFVKTDMLTKFATKILPNIKNPFILITTNSDLSSGLNEIIINDKLLIHWFGQNITKIHPKLSPLPIGLMNQYWERGRIDIIMNHLKHRKPFAQRNIDLLINFAMRKNSNREHVLEKLSKLKKKMNVVEHVTSFSTYLNELGSTKFIPSPRGNGMDCHRTWEAFMMGAVPILLRSESMPPLFENVKNIIIVDDWDDVEIAISNFVYNTEELIPDIMFANHWYNKITNYN